MDGTIPAKIIRRNMTGMMLIEYDRESTSEGFTKTSRECKVECSTQTARARRDEKDMEKRERPSGKNG